MSEAIKVANKASEVIESLLAEMLEGNHPDNEIALGELVVPGGPEVQIQLRVVSDPKEFLE